MKNMLRAACVILPSALGGALFAFIIAIPFFKSLGRQGLLIEPFNIAFVISALFLIAPYLNNSKEDGWGLYRKNLWLNGCLHGLQVFGATIVFYALALGFMAAFAGPRGSGVFFSVAYLIGAGYYSYALGPIALAAGLATIWLMTVLNGLVSPPDKQKDIFLVILTTAAVVPAAIFTFAPIFLDNTPLMQPVDKKTQCYKIDEPQTLEFYKDKKAYARLTVPGAYLRPQALPYFRQVSFLRDTHEPYCSYIKSHQVIDRPHYFERVQDLELLGSFDDYRDPLHHLSYWHNHPDQACPMTQVKSDIPGTVLYKRIEWDPQRCMPSQTPKEEEYFFPEEANPKTVYDIHCRYGREQSQSNITAAHVCELHFRYKDVLLVEAKILPADIPNFSDTISVISKLLDSFALESTTNGTGDLSQKTR